jgi:hypothetical protein
VALVEEGEDLVAFLEARDAGSDGFDYTGTVGGGDDRGAQGEGVEAFDDGQVAVVEGGGLDWGGVRNCDESWEFWVLTREDLHLTRTSFSPI